MSAPANSPPSRSGVAARPAAPPPSLSSLFASHLAPVTEPAAEPSAFPSQVMLSSSPLLPVSSSPSSWHAPAAFVTAAAALNRAASSHSGSVRATRGYQRHSTAASASSLPSSSAAAMDDSAANDMSDDAQESEAAAASGDSADVRSLATTASAGSSLSHVSAASLSSTSSLLRSLSIMPAHELQAAGVITPTPAALPAASASKSAHPPSSAPASAASSVALPSLQSSPAASGLRELGDECVWQLSSCKAGNGVSQLRDGALETFWQSDGASPHSITLHFARKTRVAAVCFYVDYKLDESYTPSRMTVRAGANAASMTDIASIELNEPTGWVTLYTLTPKQRLPQQQQQQRGTDSEAAAAASRQHSASASVSPAITPASFFSPSHPALHLPFARPPAAAATASPASSPPLSYVPIRCHYLQLLVVSSHQSGKDTHMREVRIYGPAAGARESSSRRAGGAAAATAGPGSRQLAKQSSVALFHPVFSSIEFQSTSCIR